MKKLIIFFVLILPGIPVIYAQNIDCTQQQNHVNDLTQRLNNVNSDLQDAEDNLNACLDAQQTVANVEEVVRSPAYQQVVKQETQSMDTQGTAKIGS